MPTLTGSLDTVTGRPLAPDRVRRVTVRAPYRRASLTDGSRLVSSVPDDVEVSPAGLISVNLEPGPAVLVMDGVDGRDVYELHVTADMTLLTEAMAQAAPDRSWVESQMVQLKAGAAEEARKAELQRKAADLAAAEARGDRQEIEKLRAELIEAAEQNAAPHLTKAALNATYATQARLGGLEPAPLAGSELASTTAFVCDSFGGKAWGSEAGQIKHTTDGKTWTTYCPMPVSDVMRGLIPTTDGEVICVVQNGVWKSSGWASGTPTWAQKVTANGLARITRFNVSGDGQKFIVGQYGPGAGQAWIDSRYADISVDAGNTWTRAWDSDAITGNSPVTSHIHGCCYDPWDDTFYVSEGHDVGAGIWHSTNNGVSWSRAEGMRCDDPEIGTGMDAGPTVMVATDDGLAVGSDDVLGGLYGVPRLADKMRQRLQLTYFWRPNRTGTNGFAEKGFRDPATGLVYFAFESSGPAPVILAGTANSGGLVWEWPNWTGTAEDFLESVVVVGDRLIAYGQELGQKKQLTGKVGKPGTSPKPDRGGLLGGSAQDPTSVAVGVKASTHKAIRSVAVGAGATAVGGNGTVVGYGANGGTGTGVVVVGMSASAASGQAVVIGESVSALGGQATVIGYGASSSAHGEQTAIGNSAQTSGVRTTAIGRGAQATSNQAAAIGAGAIASGLRSTAVGQLANTIHSDSIALGQGTTTTGTLQVAFGPRHIALNTMATVPNAAAAAGGGALWIQDNGSSKKQLMVRFPSGASIALATEA